MANTINLDAAILAHVTRELQGYYTGADLVVRARQTIENFKTVSQNPLHFKFIEEQRFNENIFQVETFLGWVKQPPNGSDHVESIFIKD